MNTGSRVIRVDAEVYAELKSQATGFETPNTVLRRALGLAPPDMEPEPDDEAYARTELERWRARRDADGGRED